ncbi:MAG: hypothetical protein ACK48M_01840, partial [Planctomycetia bacterium]
SIGCGERTTPVDRDCRQPRRALLTVWQTLRPQAVLRRGGNTVDRGVIDTLVRTQFGGSAPSVPLTPRSTVIPPRRKTA